VTLLVVGAITALAFALRVVGMDQSLFGDEYFTHSIVTQNGVTGVWDQVFTTSITPPLHYYVAWLALKLGGDSVVLVRLPSLLFGTATVPLMFVLGRRVGGDRVGLLAATFIALSPFAIFYSTEARTYALLMFLVTVSTLSLLQGVQDRRLRWWVLYAVASCAALWAHYTSAFVIGISALWAAWAHRGALRPVMVAFVAIGIGYLPWLPGFLEQRQNDEGLAVIAAFTSLTWEQVLEFPVRMLFGHPFLGLETLPGRVGLILIFIFAASAVALIVTRSATPGRVVPFLRSPLGLMLLLALATPVGLLLYDVLGSTLYGTRNLSSSLPALAVMVAFALSWLATIVSLRLAVPALVVVMLVLALGAVDTVRDEYRRPPTREVAHYLDEVAGGDPVVESPLDPNLDDRLGRSALDLYFDRPHPLVRFGQGDAGVWRQVREGQSVYHVVPLTGREALADSLEGLERAPSSLLKRQARLGGPDGLSIMRGRKTFTGLVPLTALHYRGGVDGVLREGSGGEVISWSFGRRVPVSPGVARGVVDGVSASGETPVLTGWAIADSRPARPADWVLCFAGGQLVAASPAGGLRKDIAEVKGAPAALAGFSLAPSLALSGTAAVRVFAVIGNRASALRSTPAVERALGT
jgi:mannosyltransferase